MKRVLVILALGLSLTGCAVLSEAQKDMVACSKDPVCFAQAKDKSSMWAGIASTVNPIAGPVVGAGLLSLFLLLGGRKKKES